MTATAGRGVWDVTWHTTLDAEEAASPVEAAVRARLHQRPGTSAVVFTVTGPDGARTEVDLGTGLDQTEPPALALAAVSRWTDDLTQPADNPRAALRAALAEWDELTTGERPLALADVARALAVTGSRVLNWLEDNDLDPGNPPSCSCGGRHWSCDYDPDAPVCESCGEPGPGLAIIRDQLTCEQCAAEDEEEEPEVCRQCCTETQGLEVIQGTPLCEACIAYNVSRCL